MNKAVHVMEAERSRQVDIMRQRVQQERDRQKVSRLVVVVETDVFPRHRFSSLTTIHLIIMCVCVCVCVCVTFLFVFHHRPYAINSVWPRLRSSVSATSTHAAAWHRRLNLVSRQQTP